MAKLELLLIIFCSVTAVILFLSAIGWIYLFSNYRYQNKQLKTLGDMNYAEKIADVSGIARKAAKDVEALDEVISKLNSKLNARWRREARADTPIKVDTVDAQEIPPETVPFRQEKQLSRRDRLKRLYG